jgi:large repetitive protein
MSNRRNLDLRRNRAFGTVVGGKTRQPRSHRPRPTFENLEARCLLAVTSTQGLPVVAAEGALFSGVVAKFASNDSPAPLSNFSSNIVWGDGITTINAIIVADPMLPGVFDVLGINTYAEEGTYAVTVSIHDAPPAAVPSDAVAASVATVSDAALTATGIPIPLVLPEGQIVAGVPTFSGTVATFTNADVAGASSDYTAVITWGDGVITQGAITGPVAGVFSVTGSHTFEEGSYPVSVLVKDAGGASATAVTTFTITDPTPLVAPIAPAAITQTEGKSFTAPVGAFTDPNLIGTTSDFSVTINWGDTTSSPGTVLQGNNGTFVVVGTHTYAEESTGGPAFQVTFSVKDVGGAVLNGATGVAITVLDAPLNAEGIDLAAVEGSAASIPAGTVVATFTDVDPAGTGTDYATTINWGDGTSGPGVIVPVAGLASTFNVTTGAGHIYTEEGKFNVRVTINDAGGATATAGSTATVADAPLTAVGTPQAGTITEGAPTVIQVASFTDADLTNTLADPLNTPADYWAVIYWGDGLSSPGTIVFNGLNGFNVTGTHTFEEGTYPARVVITDVGGGATATATTTLTVGDAGLTVAATPALTATESKQFTAQVGAFTDANPLGTVSDFSASINWGDGTPVISGIISQLPDGTFVVTGSHTYAEDTTGSPPNAITFSVKDVGGQTLVDATGASVVVNDAPLAGHGTSVQAVEGTLAGSLLVATFTDANPNATLADFGSVTIDWGDGTPLAAPASITSVGTSAGVTFSVFGSHLYVEEGSYQVTVHVTDQGGSQTFAHSHAQVADVPPTPSANQPNVSVTETVPFTLPVASFEENFGTPAEVVGDYTATIDWGDHTPNSVGTISQPNGPGTAFVVTGSHVYADSGVNGGSGPFTITTTVHEDGGTSVDIVNTASVADLAITLTGRLNPKSDSGLSNSDAITKVRQPNFFGTSERFSHVTLFATRRGGSTFKIGQTEALSDGSWSITSGVPLSDGVYTITASAIDKFDQTTTGFTNPATQVVITPTLVIDGTGPRVSSVFFDRHNGQIDVTFTDNLSGMNNSTLADASNYSFSKVHIAKQNGRPFLVNVIAVSPPGNSRFESVVLTIDQGHSIRGGFYIFLIRSARPDLVSGVQDVAGNALDGEFYGFFPSGNRVPGGDFVAELDAIHNRIFAPKTVIGGASPAFLPVTPGTSTSTKPQHVPLAAHTTTVHDTALATVATAGLKSRRRPLH